jgi:hypothetical protein
MSEANRPKDPVAEPWNSATTEPLPMPLAQMRDEARSPDSSGSLNAAGAGPKKIAEVKRSAEVESLLEGLSYPRPHVTMHRSETDGALFAAHSSGPRNVPVGVATPTLEPPLMLSQSLVEAIANPTPQPPLTRATPVEGASVPQATRPPVMTTIVVARKTYRRLAIAFAPCVVVAVVAAWLIGRSGARPASTVIVDPAAVLAQEPAVVPAATATPVAPSSSPSAAREASPVPAPPSTAASPEPVASAASPSPAAPVPARRVGGASRPVSSAKPAHPTPATSSTNDTSSLHTDFEIQN